MHILSFYGLFLFILIQMNMPAMAALNSEASIPAKTARMPSRAMSGRRLGASAPNPPRRMAKELKLAKPHKAKLTTMTVLGLSAGISGANAA